MPCMGCVYNVVSSIEVRPGLRQSPMFWCQIPNVVIASDTSNLPQDDIGNYPEAHVLNPSYASRYPEYRLMEAIRLLLLADIW